MKDKLVAYFSRFIRLSDTEKENILEDIEIAPRKKGVEVEFERNY